MAALVNGPVNFGGENTVSGIFETRGWPTLFDKEPEAFPKYSDLSLLLDIAKSTPKYASLAFEGLNADFEDQSRRHYPEAIGDAGCVLEGLKSDASLRRQKG
jgi:hypothetical protein